MREDKIRRRNELRKKNKKKGKILPLIFIFLIAAMVAGLSYFYYMTTPVDKSNNKDVKIEIKENYGSQKIAEELKNKGLIRDVTVFKLYSRIHSSSSFYVGTFNIKPSMSLSQIMDELTTKEKAKTGKTFAVIEGDSILKIAANLEKTKAVSADEFLEKVNDEQFIDTLKQKFPELITDDVKDPKIKYMLEGYLYPASYELGDKETAESLITKMVKQTNDRVVPLFKQNKGTWTINNRAQKISIHDYITMASILEKESTMDGDNKTIAGLFLNRLAIGMPLQTDPTVYYSVDKLTGTLTAEELQTQSAYNTYIIKGLPPGPIAAVGAVSYDALNNAEDHEYLYFVNATKGGKAYFAKTYAEHEELAKKYVEGYIATNNG